jgi:hypothetical protein
MQMRFFACLTGTYKTAGVIQASSSFNGDENISFLTSKGSQVPAII